MTQNEIIKHISQINNIENIKPLLICDEVLSVMACDAISVSNNAPDAQEHVSKDLSYNDIILNLSGLQFDEEKAREKWNELLKHKYIMSMKLGRNVGIRVASVDYFYNISKELKNFIVVNKENLLDSKLKALLDMHTGAYNKEFLLNHLKDIYKRAKDLNKHYSILFFDIDDFKLFNDKYGHILGDLLLIHLVKLLKKNLRSGDLVFRFGGEEFLILFEEMPKEAAFTRSEEIRKIIENYDFNNDLKYETSLNITISGGLAGIPEDGANSEELLELADGYLYKAKRFGKNKIFMK